MTDSKFIDSSVWIAYFFEGIFREHIETGINLVSALSLAEIKIKLMKRDIPKEIISKNLKFIKSKGIIIPIDEEIAESAAEISLKYNLHLADSIIYASTLKNNVELLTLDNDFRNIPDTIVLKI